MGRLDYSVADVEEQVLRAMVDAGIPPSPGERLILDGRKHRYRIDGDRNGTKNGEYCIYTDDHPAGWIKSYSGKHGSPFVLWKMNGEPLEEAERRRFRSEVNEARKVREREDADAERRAAVASRSLWENAAQPSPDHPYLVKKQVRPFGIRQLGDVLVVPLVDEEGILKAVQRIVPPDWTKLFPTGSKVAGLFCPIGKEQDGPLLLCEGWATGSTLHEVTGYQVICAMNAGNLFRVAKAMKRRFPGRKILVAADNDHTTQSGNTGVAAAERVEKHLGIPWFAPDFNGNDEGTDWNDYFLCHGMLKTKAEIAGKLAGREEEPLSAEESFDPGGPSFVHVNGKGGPKGTLENVEALLRYHRISVRYDEIAKQDEIRIANEVFSVDNERNAAIGVVTSLCHRHDVPSGNIERYLKVLADRNRFNPVREWIEGEPWDGYSRIPVLFSTIRTSKDFPEHLGNALLLRWFVSAVAAVCSEGEFTARGVLVLQGEQGIGKTSWLRRLVPSPWFGEGLTLDPADKDSVYKAVSKWIVELGELEGTFKRADLSRLKSFLTNTNDFIRLPYDAKFSSFPRRTVFSATVNTMAVLQDDTGNSRWWCLPCEEVVIDHGLDMQQIWAEVKEMYDSGCQWWLTREEERLLNEQNRRFEVPDPVEEMLLQRFTWDGYESGGMWNEWKTATEALRDCGIENPTKAQTMKASEVLRKLTGRPSERRGDSRARCFNLPQRKARSE